MFDKRSFQLSGQIVGDIDSYIDANYVREIHRKEYPLRSRRGTHVKELAEEDFNEEMLQSEETNNYPIEKVANMKINRTVYAIRKYFIGRPVGQYWSFLS